MKLKAEEQTNEAKRSLGVELPGRDNDTAHRNFNTPLVSHTVYPQLILFATS